MRSQHLPSNRSSYLLSSSYMHPNQIWAGLKLPRYLCQIVTQKSRCSRKKQSLLSDLLKAYEKFSSCVRNIYHLIDLISFVIIKHASKSNSGRNQTATVSAVHISNSEIGAHVRSNLCCLICLRHSTKSSAVKNWICFFEKIYFSICVPCMYIHILIMTTLS